MKRSSAVAPPEPTSGAISGIRTWLAAVAARSQRLGPADRLYVLVSPLGMPARAWLEAQLRDRGLLIQTRTTLVNWPRISTAVQVRQLDSTHLRRAALYESVWGTLFPGAPALAWGFEPALHDRLVQAKAALRAGVGGLGVKLGPRRNDHGVLHGFHLPDAGDGADEARKLEAALGRSPR